MPCAPLRFTGYVDHEGKLTLYAHEAYKAHQRSLAGKKVELTLKPVKSQRSIDQNSWLWGVAYPLIAEHLGYDHHEHEALHYDLLAVRFGTIAVSPKLKGAPPRIIPIRTSSELTTAEFSEYMEWLVRYSAQEFGCVVPLPNEPALCQA